jgi:hypothetical protein
MCAFAVEEVCINIAYVAILLVLCSWNSRTSYECAVWPCRFQNFANERRMSIRWFEGSSLFKRHIRSIYVWSVVTPHVGIDFISSGSTPFASSSYLPFQQFSKWTEDLECLLSLCPFQIDIAKVYSDFVPFSSSSQALKLSNVLYVILRSLLWQWCVSKSESDFCNGCSLLKTDRVQPHSIPRHFLRSEVENHSPSVVVRHSAPV